MVYARICEMTPPWCPGMILNCTPLFIFPHASGSPASATFQRRMLSFDALRKRQNSVEDTK